MFFLHTATTAAGLFSVTCGSAVGGATKTMQLTDTTDSSQGTTGYVLSYKTHIGKTIYNPQKKINTAISTIYFISCT